jgi:hypothetical protein
MWCPEEYTTLYEVAERIYDESYDWSEALSLPGTRSADAAWAFRKWYIMKIFTVFGSDIRACLPSGNVVKLHPSAYAWTYLTGSDYYDELSSYDIVCPDKIELLDLINECKFLFVDDYHLTLIRAGEESISASPFLALDGAALCIHNALIPTPDQPLVEWIIFAAREQDDAVGNGLDGYDIRGTPQKIVQAYRTGHILRRDDAKRMFGRGMKTEVWRSVWAEAVAIDPSISRPGPRRARP